MNKRKLKTIESFFKKKDKVNEVVQGQDVHVADLCRRLEETGKSDDYYLIDRLYNTYYSHF